MNTLVRSVTILIVSLLTATIGKTQTVSPVPAPTIITTAPYTISRPGYYQLGADLAYAGNGSASDAIITINASNVTLDFGGHYISGPSNTPATRLYGVYANEHGNLTIQNGIVACCYLGIAFSGTGQTNSLNINQHVEKMLVSYCYCTGVNFQGSFNSDVVNCRISFIGGSTAFEAGYGVYTDGTGIKISNNQITNVTSVTGNPGTSVGLYVSKATFLTGNTIVNCQIGISGGKYQNNLTYSCATPFSGGTDAGNNN